MLWSLWIWQNGWLWVEELEMPKSLKGCSWLETAKITRMDKRHSCFLYRYKQCFNRPSTHMLHKSATTKKLWTHVKRDTWHMTNYMKHTGAHCPGRKVNVVANNYCFRKQIWATRHKYCHRDLAWEKKWPINTGTHVGFFLYNISLYE